MEITSTKAMSLMTPEQRRQATAKRVSKSLFPLIENSLCRVESDIASWVCKKTKEERNQKQEFSLAQAQFAGLVALMLEELEKYRKQGEGRA